MLFNIKSNNAKYQQTDTLKYYFKDINKYPLLSIEEEKNLFNVYKTGTPIEKKKAKDKIIKCNLRYVISIARRYGTERNILDLINEGNKGLIKAVEAFNPHWAEDSKIERGYDCDYAKFSVCATYYVSREIRHYLTHEDNMVRKANAVKTYSLVPKATNLFMQREGRKPTSPELLEILNTEFNANIKDISDLTNVGMCSIDAPMDDDNLNPDYNDFLMTSANTNSYENTMQSEYNKNLVESLLKTLKDRDRKVIEMAFSIGYMRSYEVEEIAREVGLTNERVRQIKEEVIKKLRKVYMQKFKKM